MSVNPLQLLANDLSSVFLSLNQAVRTLLRFIVSCRSYRGATDERLK